MTVDEALDRLQATCDALGEPYTDELDDEAVATLRRYVDQVQTIIRSEVREDYRGHPYLPTPAIDRLNAAREGRDA